MATFLLSQRAAQISARAWISDLLPGGGPRNSLDLDDVKYGRWDEGIQFLVLAFQQLCKSRALAMVHTQV